MLGTWRYALLLGALVGLVEGCAIVRYDWIMDDPQPWRLGAGVLWVGLILALNGLVFVGLNRLCRRRLTVLSLVWLVSICGVRAWSGDRFEWWSVIPALLALGLSRGLDRSPRLLGLFAVCLALPGLWGKVPIYGSAWVEWFEILGPGVLLVILLGGWVGRLEVRASLGRPLAIAGVAILGLGGALAGLAPRGAPETPVLSERPNIIFVLVDTLRADHVEPFGERSTPSSRRLAAEGMRFDDAITVIPKTTQSVAAFHTGRYPVSNGVRVLADTLAADEETLAEALQAEGYRTAAFVHNGWVMRGRGFEQGFDQFWSYFEIERAWGPLRLTSLVTVLDWLSLRRIRPFDGNTEASVLTDVALDWLDRSAGRGQPFFAYLHYFDPHWPYRPPGEDSEIMVNQIKDLKWSRGQMIFDNPLPAEENAEAVRLYGLEVDHNIDQVGRLLDFLDARGLSENTIVVFTADHGHHLGDHDYWYHHGEFLYEPGLRIPMLLRYPDGVPAGSIESAQFRSIDLAPTLLELAGLQPIPDLDGLALSQIRSEGAPAAFLETDISYFKMNKKRKIKGSVGKVRGARSGRWKLHYTPRNGKGLWELYDLESDPDESRNLIKRADPDVLWPLVQVVAAGIPSEERAQLEALGNRFDVLPDGSDPPAGLDDEGAGGDEEVNDNDRSMLEALGYIDN